ncbi:hypothetical protein V5799_016857 [Amblyomma americanum]|uniref:Uncharacterized protein n=1 Tax=Amblyomma americanum TaxID=6943 RepID=A0AAQ4F3Y5_AMBAM
MDAGDAVPGPNAAENHPCLLNGQQEADLVLGHASLMVKAVVGGPLRHVAGVHQQEGEGLVTQSPAPETPAAPLFKVSVKTSQCVYSCAQPERLWHK